MKYNSSAVGIMSVVVLGLFLGCGGTFSSTTTEEISKDSIKQPDIAHEIKPEKKIDIVEKGAIIKNETDDIEKEDDIVLEKNTSKKKIDIIQDITKEKVDIAIDINETEKKDIIIK